MPDSLTLLGFDFGKQRIGVAVGQTLTNSTSPLTTLNAVVNKPDWATISRVIADWQPDALVVGIPFNMDGTEQEMTHAARRFCRQLAERYRLPIHTVDERLSSIAARERLAASSQSRKKKHDTTDLDKIAAQVILETWLLHQ